MEQQINFNPFAYPDWTCSECGHNIFTPGVVFKKVPGVVLGEGKGDVPFPIKVATCQKCGAMFPYDKKSFDEAAKRNKDNTSGSGSGLII